MSFIHCYRYHLFLVLALFLSGIACRKQNSTQNSGQVHYDPAQDPLVNPPALFESPPADPCLISRQETLYLTLRTNPGTLNPLFVSSVSAFIVVDVLFKNLVLVDQNMDWQINKEMVRSFEESADHTIFIVRLKPHLKWQDGSSLRAQDVVFSWQQIKDPQVPAWGQKRSINPITECVALDDFTIKYVQPKPDAMRRWNLLFPIIPKHIFEKDKAKYPDLKSGAWYEQQRRNPIGNGPYKILEWKDKERIILERWEDYYGRKPYIQRLVFRIIPDEKTALYYLEQGKVDLIDQLSTRRFALETNTPAFQKVAGKVWSVQPIFRYIGWNMDGSNPFFQDCRVRRALTCALNIPLILEKVYYNLAAPCGGIYHPDSWMYNPNVKKLEYDLEKSAALLDKAGWKVDPQHGWRSKQIEGRNVTFEFSLLAPLNPPYVSQIAAIFQEDLKKLGINMKIRQLEWSAFLEMIRGHQFQAMLNIWSPGPDPDLDRSVWHSAGYALGRNYIGYSNPQIDGLYEKGRFEFDFQARRRIYQEIHKILYEDQPYTWIVHEPDLAVINKRIRGVQQGPQGIFRFYPGIERWWIPHS